MFSDRVHVEEWLAGAYSAIPRNYMHMLRYYDIYADDYSPNTGWEAYDWDGISKIKGNWDSKSSWRGDYWNELPRRIRSCYILINNIHPLGDELPEREVNLIKAESQFLIAYYYYLLVNTYGAVSLLKEEVDLNASAESLMLGQSTYDEAIDWIDSQLMDAAGKLPPYYTENMKYGRATSVMCLAVRARMLLFAASPLVNGNQRPEYVNFKNDKGEPVFNSTYQPEKWQRATGEAPAM